MKDRYEFFSTVNIYEEDLEKKPISNFHFEKKFASILFYSVSFSYNKFLPETIVDTLGRKFILDQYLTEYKIRGNIYKIKLIVTAFYDLAQTTVTPARQPVQSVRGEHVQPVRQLIL